MLLFVRTLAGEAIAVNADPSDTIYNVKTRIHSESGDPMSNHCLMFDGKELEEGRTIADYGIDKESVVQLALLPKPTRGPMQIFLKMPNGRLLLDDLGWSHPRFISGSAASTAGPLRFTSLTLACLSFGPASGSLWRARRLS